MPDGSPQTDNRSTAEKVAALLPSARAEILDGFTEEQLAGLEWDWSFWGRPKQMEPKWRWRTWMILAGRGFGKTRSGAEWVRSIICGATPLGAGQCGRIALIGETTSDVRDVMIEGASGILSVHPPAFRPLYEPSKRRLTWPNGAVATCYNGTEPDQLRGPQFDAAWIDELAKLYYMQEVWDELQMGLRLGTWPRTLATTTPRPLTLIKKLMKNPTTHVTDGSSYENAANLAEGFLKSIREQYEGTRRGMQEIYAKILDDNPYALWKQDWIDKARVSAKETPELMKILVAVDPPVTSGEDADECGIVVGGRTEREEAFILEDASMKGLSPAEWAERAVSRFYKWRADAIVVEVNNGGDLVANTIRMVDANVPIRTVHASRGKIIRAQPVAALYEQGKVRHAGTFGELETQMSEFTTDFSRKAMGYSPDRVDALVWLLSELMLKERRLAPRVRRI